MVKPTEPTDDLGDRLKRAEAKAAKWRDRAARAEARALRQHRKILKLSATHTEKNKAAKRRAREIRRRLERAAEWEREAGRAECRAARHERRAARISRQMGDTVS